MEKDVLENCGGGLVDESWNRGTRHRWIRFEVARSWFVDGRMGRRDSFYFGCTVQVGMKGRWGYPWRIDVTTSADEGTGPSNCEDESCRE